jgi:hypothetical protein
MSRPDDNDISQIARNQSQAPEHECAKKQFAELIVVSCQRPQIFRANLQDLSRRSYSGQHNRSLAANHSSLASKHSRGQDGNYPLSLSIRLYDFDSSGQEYVKWNRKIPWPVQHLAELNNTRSSK